jgi:hypothetical protein
MEASKMEDQEPTAWEDINPAAMVSAPRPAPPETYSDRLKPASNIEFRNELTACLALVVPVGMTEEGRREWLAVAWETLKHLPADLLARGCRKARQTCDHPSKIVPTIIAETADHMKWRRETARPESPHRALPGPQPCTPEEAAAILEEFGLKSKFANNQKDT